MARKEPSIQEVYDLVHQAAQEAGHEREFLAEFGSREAYLKTCKAEA